VQAALGGLLRNLGDQFAAPISAPDVADCCVSHKVVLYAGRNDPELVTRTRRRSNYINLIETVVKGGLSVNEQRSLNEGICKEIDVE
jgi:hypothetical protein